MTPHSSAGGTIAISSASATALSIGLMTTSSVGDLDFTILQGKMVWDKLDAKNCHGVMTRRERWCVVELGAKAIAWKMKER